MMTRSLITVVLLVAMLPGTAWAFGDRGWGWKPKPCHHCVTAGEITVGRWRTAAADLEQPDGVRRLHVQDSTGFHGGVRLGFGPILFADVDYGSARATIGVTERLKIEHTRTRAGAGWFFHRGDAVTLYVRGGWRSACDRLEHDPDGAPRQTASARSSGHGLGGGVIVPFGSDRLRLELQGMAYGGKDRAREAVGQVSVRFVRALWLTAGYEYVEHTRTAHNAIVQLDHGGHALRRGERTRAARAGIVIRF